MQVDPEAVYERLLASPGVVFLVGSMDAGKTTFAMELLRRAMANGIPSALVDSDIGQSVVGPPATVGLKMIQDQSVTVESLHSPDAMGFVGALSPRNHLLPLVTSTGNLVGKARKDGAEMIVVDTTGFVSGVYAQILKYHKMTAVDPNYVVAFERGGDLELVVGIAQRFTAAEVLELPAASDLSARTAEERASWREQRFGAYFSTGTSRWRVKPTVFMPTLPPGFELARLDGLIVGMEDGSGACVGIGVLEYEAGEDILRMVSPVSEGVKGLRLGSIRIDAQGRYKGAVSLRQLFGTE